MRILIFSLTYDYQKMGGAEVAIRELTNRLPDIEFDLIAMRSDPALRSMERLGNVNVYRVGSGASYINKILFVPRAALLGLKLNKKRTYDKLWAMMTNMSFPIVLMRMAGNKTPYILTLQDGDPFEYVFERLHIRIFKPLLLYGFRSADVIQPISNFLATWAERLGYRGRIEMIPNGVPTAEFMKDIPESEVAEARQRMGKKEDDVIIASSSRLIGKNGLDDVVRALPLLPENVKFCNWGFGPDKDILLKLAEELGVSNRVHLFPHNPAELPADFRASDIFIRPSLSEGQGISFLEGMAAGLPIIGTPVGGIPDFLFDPDKDHDMLPTGLFVNVRDPKSIAVQVKRLIDDEPLREKLIENARKLASEKYDWDLISREMKSRVFRI